MKNVRLARCNDARCHRVWCVVHIESFSNETERGTTRCHWGRARLSEIDTDNLRPISMSSWETPFRQSALNEWAIRTTKLRAGCKTTNTDDVALRLSTFDEKARLITLDYLMHKPYELLCHGGLWAALIKRTYPLLGYADEFLQRTSNC